MFDNDRNVGVRLLGRKYDEAVLVSEELKSEPRSATGETFDQ